MVRPYLSDIINDHETQKDWKIQLIIAISFTSSKDSDDTRTIYTKRDNIEILMSSETDEIIEELFERLLQRFQEGLEESMRGSEVIFDSVKLILSLGGSYIDSPEWLKNKKATINPKNNDDKCFQYAVTGALNNKQINSNPQRISNIKPFISQYNWKEMYFPSHRKDWEKFQLNKIALNILYVPYNTEGVRHAYKSKHNLKRENQVIPLVITDGKK